MFTTNSVLSSVRKGDDMFKIDLQDAYFHVPIHPSSRKYLRFAFENKVYQFQVLPIGLNTAPQVFTRLGHTVTGYLHRQGISVDLTQDLHFLGSRLRLDLGEASLPESKAFEIVASARHLSSLRVLTYSQVSQLMGSLNWASGLIRLGRLYLRPLQRHFHSLGLAVDALSHDWEVNVHVSSIPSAQQSHSEAPVHPDGRGNSHSPLVAKSVMVSTPTSSLCGTPSSLSLPSRSSVPTGSKVCLGRKVVPSARMEALMRHYKAAAPRRPSTNRMYDDRWLRFAIWVAGQGFDPLDPTAAQIASFLFTLFDTHGLSPQTVKGYRTCLGSVLNRTGKAKVVLHKTYSSNRKGLVLHFTLAQSSCARTRNRIKSMIPGIFQRSQLASQSLALLTVL